MSKENQEQDDTNEIVVKLLRHLRKGSPEIIKKVWDTELNLQKQLSAGSIVKMIIYNKNNNWFVPIMDGD